MWLYLVSMKGLDTRRSTSASSHRREGLTQMFSPSKAEPPQRSTQRVEHGTYCRILPHIANFPPLHPRINAHFVDRDLPIDIAVGCQRFEEMHPDLLLDVRAQQAKAEFVDR